MATVSRELPLQPHLDVPKREARTLLAAFQAGEVDALGRVRNRHPRFQDPDDDARAKSPFKLADAQLVVAREYGFSSWPELKRRVLARDAAHQLQAAMQANDRATVVALLRRNPELLHVPLWSGNWGPPMSHAANLGRLEIVQAIHELGARDHQHAFDRALLQGRIDCARWLQEHGAQLVPGIVLGVCETLNAAGFRFLSDCGAPLTDGQGDRAAPLALTLQTYARNPAGKHAILAGFEQQGHFFPDTPICALHRGDLPRLREHLQRDPRLLNRRFALHEIYPAELGCTHDGRSGMHWTPIDGGTLLHLAIDFQEPAIIEWLLAAGADANARATVDSEGFGGHTPLFNAVVNGTERDAAATQALLKRGALTDIRANLRKFLDWRDEPGWHVAREVTPLEWARSFPDRSWVNVPALQVLESRSAT